MFTHTKPFSVLHSILAVLALAVLTSNAHASLLVSTDQSKSTEDKAVIELKLQNTYTNTVESARAAVFLLDDHGKVVGQGAQWVIGGGKDKPSLAPNASSRYFMTIPTRKKFTAVKVLFTRIVLGGGKVIQAGKGFELQK